ncbi:MAG: hypothetical protein AAGF31_03945, partial [Planctomycetota bacterium]
MKSSYARRLHAEQLEDRRMLAVMGFNGDYELQNWSASTTAGTSITPSSGSSDTATFSSAVTIPLSSGTYFVDFTLPSSPETGSVSFDYAYAGQNSLGSRSGILTTLGASAVNVENTPFASSFSVSGSATFIAEKDQPLGFQIGGVFFSSQFPSNVLSDNLTITNFVAHDSLVVDSTSDLDDGDYSKGNFTLREAIDVANSIAGA